MAGDFWVIERRSDYWPSLFGRHAAWQSGASPSADTTDTADTADTADTTVVLTPLVLTPLTLVVLTQKNVLTLRPVLSQMLQQEKGARLTRLLRALMSRPWVPGRYLSTAKYMLSDFREFVAASWDNLPEAEVSTITHRKCQYERHRPRIHEQKNSKVSNG